MLLLALTACVSSPWGMEPELELSAAIPTVASVRVHPDEPVDEVWVALEEGRTVEAHLEGDTWVARFIAAPPQTEFTWQVQARRGASERSTRLLSQRTGRGPAGFPEIEVQVLDPEGAHQGTLLTTLMGTPTAAVLLDAQGRLLWWHPQEGSSANVGRARMDRDGAGIWHTTHVLGGPASSLVWTSLDGSLTETLATPDLHHDFWVLSDGGLAWLQSDIRLVDGVAVEGDALVERSPEGEVYPIYSIWDDVAYDPEDDVVPGPGWSHANSLEYDEDEARVLLSFMGLDSVLELDRASGRPRWILGGPAADLSDDQGRTQLLSRPHQPTWVDGGLLLFDNGERQRGDSRALELDLDLDAHRVLPTWSWSDEPPRYCFAMGDVQRLPDGSTLIDYSSLGLMEQVSPEDEVVWRLQVEEGHPLGYATWLPSL